MHITDPIADAGQHIRNRICDVHLCYPPNLELQDPSGLFRRRGITANLEITGDLSSSFLFPQLLSCTRQSAEPIKPGRIRGSALRRPAESVFYQLAFFTPGISPL